MDDNATVDMRIDKWLWAARFFKTRSLAAHACDLGRIACNGQQVKPSRELHAGDRLTVKNESGDFQVDVLGLSEIRCPAPMAQRLYQETDESRQARLLLGQQRKAMLPVESTREGKPSKRDRRQIARLRGRG
jgi:ribosome-associated heat shock protein Hsp15